MEIGLAIIAVGVVVWLIKLGLSVVYWNKSSGTVNADKKRSLQEKWSGILTFTTVSSKFLIGVGFVFVVGSYLF